MIYIKEYPNQEELRRLFSYKNGFLYWNPRSRTDFSRTQAYGAFKANCEGKIAHSEQSNNYKKIKINGEIYFTHRLIYIWHFGDLSKYFEVDHKDGNPSNNLVSNLRIALRSENICNTSFSSRNTSGIKGVSWDKFRNKWVGQIKSGNNLIRKRFVSKDDAEKFVKQVREEKHGNFANHGR